MLEINLLPDEFRVKLADKSEAKGIPLDRVAIYGGLTSLALSVVLAISFVIFSFAVSGLKAKYISLEPKIKEVEDARGDLSDMEFKIKSINELTASRICWTGILSGLNDCILPNTWLFNLKTTVKDSKGTLTIEGFAMGSPEVGTTSVGKLIDSMKKNEYLSAEFSEIQLDSINQAQMEGQEVMQFRLLCIFKEAPLAKV